MNFRSCILLFVSLAVSVKGISQLCTGSLGDPIVNITFGSGTNPGPPLSAASTNYSYVSNDCPNDGYYTVRNGTSSCFSNTWHTVFSDHTGDPNGYFMLVNASFDPGTFYVDTVDVLCANTTYEFAAWILNVLGNNFCSPAIQPNITFNLERPDKTIIQSYNTGIIPQGFSQAWKQYGFFFTTPPDVSRVVLRIINNAPGGCGNDLALDDITFRPCGPLVSAYLNGSDAPVDLCEGASLPLILTSDVSAGFTDPHFQWQVSVNGGSWKDIPGANNLTLAQQVNAATQWGVYRYRLSVSKRENVGKPSCSINSNTLTVRVNKKPVPQAAYTGRPCEENTVTLLAKDGDRYDWTGPAGFAASGPAVNLPAIKINQSGTYYVSVSTDAGCTGSDSVQLLINPRPVATASPDTVAVCEGRSTTLVATGGGTYLWKPALGLSSFTAPGPSASPVDTTRYMVVVTNSFACTDTAYALVNVYKKPVADAGPDQYIMQGSTAQLTGAVGGTDVSFQWRPSFFIDHEDVLDPQVNPDADLTYILQVESGAGCGLATDSVKVHVFKAVYVPNAFTPNGDGLNDTWNIPALRAYNHYEIKVFNRYGGLIYQSKDMSKPWDGSFKGAPQATGVYPYLIDVKDTGTKLKGWVMVIR
jgi:gliding motility-associated-like protein